MNLRGSKFLAVSVLSVGLFFGIACSDDDDATDDLPALPADSGAPATSPEANDSQSEADFAIEVQDKLTRFQNDLAELDTEAATMDDAARAEIDPMLEELRTTVTTLESQLFDLQATPDGPGREAVMSEIEDTLALAQTQVDQLQAVVGI
jgi:hypothetical protein